MKAVIGTRSGSPDVLQLRDVEKPSPADGEVLIKVHAATVTSGDIMLRKLNPLLVLPMRLFGVRRKRIPGHEFAGEIEAVGSAVRSFKVGDAVFGTTTGLSVGANAEYVCVPEAATQGVLALKPAGVSYAEAAAAPVGGMTALYLLKQANVQSGEKVLIYGASGSVGTFAVQLAKHFGAEVTGVCSTANVEMVRSLGASRVIDYTQDDFAEGDERYDVIFDAVGKSSPSRSKNALKPDGRYISVRSSTRESVDNLIFIGELLAAGQIRTVIDRRFPLEQTAEAHRYVEQGHKKGNLVITVTGESTI